MAWNIFMVPPMIFKSCQTERAFLIADYIKIQNPDILVLEETFMKSTRSIISDSLKMIYPFQSSITKPGFFKTNSGVWIFSKFPIQKQAFITYKNKTSSDVFAKKGATFIQLEILNKKIQIIGTHTQSLNKNVTKRFKQFNQLKKKMLDIYMDDSIPQFIIGDLNSNYYDTTEYNAMIQTLETLPVSFTGEKYSWNGLQNDLANKFSEHSLETLDYILLRKQHVSKAEIISTEILKPTKDTCFCKYKFQNLSDHHPIISTIKLK
ncbi:MAG TPA: sphingomyelin phosphodiesterase [Chitinophagales bacterium]|nr:sphingomyelin phosphodiesterase [Chitinophagales bacterium]